MPRARSQEFEHLSPSERAVVGSPEEYNWDDAVRLPARGRPAVTQFSLRIDKALFDELQALAKARGVTLSDVAREGLERYVRAGGRPAVSNIQVSFPSDAGLLVQVAGTRAELAANRRTVSPDERVPVPAGASRTY